jgi:hypothetical protein
MARAVKDHLLPRRNVLRQYPPNADTPQAFRTGQWSAAHAVLKGGIMKRTAHRVQQRPTGWRGFDYAELHRDAADRFADRVSEEPPDAEDERIEVEIILRRMIRDMN